MTGVTEVNDTKSWTKFLHGAVIFINFVFPWTFQLLVTKCGYSLTDWAVVLKLLMFSG